MEKNFRPIRRLRIEQIITAVMAATGLLAAATAGAISLMLHAVSTEVLMPPGTSFLFSSWTLMSLALWAMGLWAFYSFWSTRWTIRLAMEAEENAAEGWTARFHDKGWGEPNLENLFQITEQDDNSPIQLIYYRSSN